MLIKLQISPCFIKLEWDKRQMINGFLTGIKNGRFEIFQQVKKGLIIFSINKGNFKNK